MTQRTFNEQLEPDFQPWEKIGDQVEGWLMQPETMRSSEGNEMVKRYVSVDGNLIGFLSGKALEPKLIPHTGEYVRITFTGTQETRNGEMKIHKVEFATE